MFTCRTMCSVDAVMIYWLSSSIGSSLRIYYETSAVMPGTDRTAAENRARYVEVPTGMAVFKGELSKPPRQWCELNHNLVSASGAAFNME